MKQDRNAPTLLQRKGVQSLVASLLCIVIGLLAVKNGADVISEARETPPH